MIVIKFLNLEVEVETKSQAQSVKAETETILLDCSVRRIFFLSVPVSKTITQLCNKANFVRSLISNTRNDSNRETICFNLIRSCCVAISNLSLILASRNTYLSIAEEAYLIPLSKTVAEIWLNVK